MVTFLVAPEPRLLIMQARGRPSRRRMSTTFQLCPAGQGQGGEGVHQGVRGELVWVCGLGDDEHEPAELGCGRADSAFCRTDVSHRPPVNADAECGLAQVAGHPGGRVPDRHAAGGMGEPRCGEGWFQPRIPAAGTFGQRHFFQGGIDQQPGRPDHPAAVLEGQ